jgi:hypothetical protein
VVVNRRAPVTIDAVTPRPGDGVGVGEGVGDGVDGEFEDPQPNEIASSTVAIVIRRARMIPPDFFRSITANALHSSAVLRGVPTCPDAVGT